MTIIRNADSRRTETPNAVMTTLASPTLGGARQSLWRVEMRPGQAGPRHRFDSEQTWTAIDGVAELELGDERATLRAGDTALLPADVERRIVADPAAGFAAIVAGDPTGHALLPDGTDRGVPAWIA
jgi:quercetin dioxygenase-like cupin family protein